MADILQGATGEPAAKRQRKSADKFEYDHKETKKAAVGTGTPLGELTGVNENMMNPKFKDTLEALHLLVLKSKGAKGKVRKNLAAFSGLVYSQPDERQRYADRLGKLKIPVVHAMLDMLRVDRSSKSFEGGKVDKEAVCGRLLDFLENPDNAGVKKASRVTRAPLRAARVRRQGLPSAVAPARRRAAHGRVPLPRLVRRGALRPAVPRGARRAAPAPRVGLSLIHISEPTSPY